MPNVISISANNMRTISVIQLGEYVSLLKISSPNIINSGIKRSKEKAVGTNDQASIVLNCEKDAFPFSHLPVTSKSQA